MSGTNVDECLLAYAVRAQRREELLRSQRRVDFLGNNCNASLR